MKIAIIGDIHGNHLALEAVLRDIKKEGIDIILAAGDYVGYYYHPAEVFNLLEKWHLEAIKGNHEQILLDIFKGNGKLRELYRKKFGNGIEIGIEKLDDKQISYISKLPEKKALTFKGKRILLCHGSPWDINEYIYPDSPPEAFERFIHEGYNIVIMGHTHYPMLKRIAKVLFVNAGSVGQARTAPVGAHWALLDTEKMKIKHRVTKYNIDYVVKEVLRIDSNIPYLHQVLLRNRLPYHKTSAD